jgi:hypothetical protein
LLDKKARWFSRLPQYLLLFSLLFDLLFFAVRVKLAVAHFPVLMVGEKLDSSFIALKTKPGFRGGVFLASKNLAIYSLFLTN